MSINTRVVDISDGVMIICTVPSLRYLVSGRVVVKTAFVPRIPFMPLIVIVSLYVLLAQLDKFDIIRKPVLGPSFDSGAPSLRRACNE